MKTQSDTSFEQIQQQSILDLSKLNQRCRAALGCIGEISRIGISRRDFVKTGAATLAAVAAYEPTVHRLAGPLSVVKGPGRVSLQVNSKDLFVIHERAFAGLPHVGLDSGRSRYLVWLENARIPGSKRLADLQLELWEGLFDWQYRLAFSDLGLTFRGNLASWLSGGEGAWIKHSDFQFDGRACALEAQGCASIAFFPDWRLKFQLGNLRARAGHLLLNASSAALQIPQNDFESILREGGGPTSVLHLTRGSAPWQIEPKLAGCEYAVHLSPSAFDTLRVESTERGAVQHAALLAEGQTKPAAVAVPITRFVGTDGSALTLPLGNLRYAAGLDDTSEYLAADFADTGLRLPGLSLSIHNGSEHAGFQVASAGGTTATSCQPAVSVSPQLPGALVETTDIPGAASLPLSWGKFWCKVGRFLHLDSESRRACLSPGDSPLVVKVVRPQDFVNLTLEFHGMQFHCHHGDSFLQPVPGKAKDAIIVVRFPPQHLQEQCFHAKDASCGPATLDSEKPVPPVRTRISGDSRLVFQPFIKDDDVLPFTLKSLLDWSSWRLVVTELAKPPVDIDGEFTQDGRIETDFICDFTTARIIGIDASSKTITIDQKSEARYTRLEVPDQNGTSSIVKDGVQLLSPTRLQLVDVTDLQNAQQCILSVPCNPLPQAQRPTQSPQPPADEQPEANGQSKADGQTKIETAIELPYRLIISPNTHAQFQSSKPPDSSSTRRIELWHSRLKSGSELEIADPQSKRWQAIRAVWSPDFQSADPFPVAGANPATCEPMTSEDRKNLVVSSTDFNSKTSRGDWFNPFAMPVKTLALSSLGGWLDGKVAWEPEACLDVEGWEQHTFAARDNVVKLQYKGFLIPTGHRCVLQKLTQREWWITPDNKPLAILVQRCQLLFPRPRKTYPAVGQQFKSRDFPFVSATIAVSKSPYLDETCNDPPYLVPHVCGHWFAIPLELVDLDGRTIKCELPMVYVSNSTVFGGAPAGCIPGTLDTSAKLNDALAAFAPSGCTPANLQNTSMRQQKIAYAPSAKPGDTAFATNSLAWCYSAPDKSSTNLRARFDQPPWYPTIQQASVQLGSVQAFSGKDTPSIVSFPAEYVRNGFPSEGGQTNTGEAFLKIENNRASFEFPGEKGGGIILPKVDVGALSRKLGLLGGDAQQAINNAFGGTFDACQFFPDGATLLGAIRLCEIITLVANISGLSNRVPKLVQQEIRDLQQNFENIKTDLQQKILDVYSPIKAAVNGYATGLTNATETLGFRLAKITSGIGISDTAVRVDSTAGFLLGANTYGLIDLEVVALIAASGSTFTVTRGQFGTTAASHNKDAILTQDVSPVVIGILGDAATLTQFQQTASQAFSDINQVQNLPQLREYFVQQIAQSAGVSQQDIDNLRTKFNQVGQDKLRALNGAFTKATSDLTNAAILKLDSAVTSLQEAVSNADVSKLADALRTLKDVLEQVLTTASAVQTQVNQIKAIVDDLKNQVNQAKQQVNTAISGLKQEAQAAKWNLQNQAKQAIQQKLQEYQQEADAAVAPLLASADALYSAVQADINSTLKTVGEQIDKALADIQQTLLGTILSALDLPTGIRVTYDFSPQLQDAPTSNPLFKAARAGKAAALDIHSVVDKRFDGSPPTSQVSVVLRDFELHLFPFAPFIVLPVTTLSMNSKNGGKPDVQVDIDQNNVRFLGPLNFVEQLQSLLHFGNISIVPSPTDVRAIATINLPKISTGGFNLENINFNTSLILSFLGEAVTFRFAFAERSRPCLLSFGIFGGTFFVALELRSRSDFVKIEAALEFGAVAALDLGVASGEIHIFGGFYFKTEPNHLMLQGYIRAGGELSILGIVSMSVEFYLALAYENRAGKAWLVGECTVTVEVSVLFFSASVGLTLRKEFSGGGESSSKEIFPPETESPQWASLDHSALPGFPRLREEFDDTSPATREQCYGKDWIPVYHKEHESYAW